MGLGIFGWRVTHNTRLRYLSVNERDQLDSIVKRFRAIEKSEEKPDMARALMDVRHLLNIIGGDYCVGEPLYPGGLQTKERDR